MALKLLDLPFLEGLLHLRDCGIRGDDIPPLFELEGPFELPDLDLTADALGTLPPLELYSIELMLVQDVFRHAKACILHIHLHEDLTIPLLEPPVGLDAAIHLGRALDLPIVVELQLGVDAADVFATHEGDPRDGGPDGEVLPVLLGDEGGAQGTGEDGYAHPDLFIPSIRRLGINSRKNSRIRAL